MIGRPMQRGRAVGLRRRDVRSLRDHGQRRVTIAGLDDVGEQIVGPGGGDEEDRSQRGGEERAHCGALGRPVGERVPAPPKKPS